MSSDVHDITYTIGNKRLKELAAFLIELDSIADTLYNKLEYNGVWETLMSLEDVRVRYYVEYHEQKKILSLKGKRNVR